MLDVREGTAPLQRRRSSVLAMIPVVAATERQAQQSLSLITPARSLDLDTLTAGDYRLLLDGFRAAVVVARAKQEHSPKSSAGVVGGDGGRAKKAPPPAAGTV